MAVYKNADDEGFVRMVIYFFEEKGTPTRYAGWEAERCQKLMPLFYEAWCKAELYEKFAKLAARDAYPGEA